MGVTIYADVVLFINFFMDLLIFWILAKLIKKKVSWRRLLLGSAAAAIFYCIILFVPILNRYYNFFGALLILTTAIFITFRPKSAKELIKLIFFAHISAFAAGGAAMALFYFTNISSVAGSSITYSIGHFSWKLLLASSAGIYIAIKLGMGWIHANITNKKDFCTLIIYFGGRQVQATALVDTGNALCDPITGASVVVVETKVVNDFLPLAARQMLLETPEAGAEKLAEKLSGCELSKRIRLIPFKSLGTQCGMLLGFKPDRLEIVSGEKARDVPIPAIIGIYNHPLGLNKGYDALIAPELVA